MIILLSLMEMKTITNNMPIPMQIITRLEEMEAHSQQLLAVHKGIASTDAWL